jgi:cation transporter-like permease
MNINDTQDETLNRTLLAVVASGLVSGFCGESPELVGDTVANIAQVVEPVSIAAGGVMGAVMGAAASQGKRLGHFWITFSRNATKAAYAITGAVVYAGLMYGITLLSSDFGDTAVYVSQNRDFLVNELGDHLGI